MPSETEFVATLDTSAASGKVPPLEATEEQLQRAAEQAVAPRRAQQPRRAGARSSRTRRSSRPPR